MVQSVYPLLSGRPFTRQTGTTLQNSVRVSATIRLPGRKQKPDYSTLADLLFASVGVPVVEEVA